MTEHHTEDGTADAPRRRDRAAGILRAATAAAAGIGYGYVTHDVGQALTVTTVALHLLREAFTRPAR